MRQVLAQLQRVMCNTPPSSARACPDGSSCLPQSNPVISCCEGKTANTPSFRSHHHHRRRCLPPPPHPLCPFYLPTFLSAYLLILIQCLPNPYLPFHLAITKLETYQPDLHSHTSGRKMIQAILVVNGS